MQLQLVSLMSEDGIGYLIGQEATDEDEDATRSKCPPHTCTSSRSFAAGHLLYYNIYSGITVDLPSKDL
jgi:hypothetical protein